MEWEILNQCYSNEHSTTALTTWWLRPTNALLQTACFSPPHESKLLPDSGDHLRLPIPYKQSVLYRNPQARHILTTFVSTLRRKPSNIAESFLHAASASRFHF